MKKIEYWEFALGFYPGILLGYRCYREEHSNTHVLYFPFLDISLTIEY